MLLSITYCILNMWHVGIKWQKAVSAAFKKLTVKKKSSKYVKVKQTL